MTDPRKDPLASSKSKARKITAQPDPCMGLEAEFTLYVNGQKRAPEEVFGNPRHVVRAEMIPRAGRSWHLPSGGALYFDTGVIEVATPIIELGPGCAVRAGHSLWEQIAYVRTELDAWEKKQGVEVRLEGFSAHYNISIPENRALDGAGMHQLALLLTYLLHPPVMLLTANRLSTGIGVRPRDGRIEITADFTPSPEMMVAAASLIGGIVREVALWPDHDLGALARRGFPVIAGFKPCAHTSRKGYLARFDCFPSNPFTANPSETLWQLEDGRQLTMRKIAHEIAHPFRRAIHAVGDSDAGEHVFAVLNERARSFLDFPERPSRYEDVGRQIEWNRRSRRRLPHSRYERVIHRVLTRQPIRVGSFVYRPERMLGWYEIAFRNVKTGDRRIFTLDELATHA
ncbi:MAG: hypothetical protein JWL59_1303 [Chthoniobacteraceae bacterium]|nr:hypothetical protein [Chthoniobacteraceae bacterium]